MSPELAYTLITVSDCLEQEGLKLKPVPPTQERPVEGMIIPEFEGNVK